MSDLEFEFQDDCERMCRVARDHGMELTPEVCRERWEMLSADSFASWICLPPDDSELWRAIGDMMKPRIITRVISDGISTKDGLS